ncbi:hypothetical protein EV363DRAFT_1322911 [Boletus edulis]|nr:hypothetical protein EV363DRAFT_1322911 [Boletus edulis]
MTLLKLCETAIIRSYLRDINLPDVFLRQMRHKDTALLAAYALTTCLKYNMESINDNQDLPQHIVRMLRLDYFDDAVCRVEGFQIFRELMQHADLRAKIMNYGIIDVLRTKLGKGKPKEIRTSLICLDIFRSCDPTNPWTRELVNSGLGNLKKREWKAQKAGVAILHALAHTGILP